MVDEDEINRAFFLTGLEVELSLGESASKSGLLLLDLDPELELHPLVGGFEFFFLTCQSKKSEILRSSSSFLWLAS